MAQDPTRTPGLVETSFAEAILMISADEELTEQTRRHWATSLRQIARMLDRPLELIPARYSAVRADLGNLHHAPVGLTIKTLQNHRSNAKSALLWLARERDVPKHGAPMTPAWECLWARVSERPLRHRLSSFARFCSAAGIAPAEVDEAVVGRFVSYRSSSAKPAGGSFQRLLARAWNACVDSVEGWPPVRLIEPEVKAAVEVAWEDFPPRLRADIDCYLAGLGEVRRSRSGQRIRPLKDSTIRTRRAELAAAIRMAVKEGVLIESLGSLSALLAPAVAGKVLDAYWRQNGETPKPFTIDLACRFVAIARETGCLDDAGCEQLDEYRRAFEDHRSGGFTDKNIALVRQVLTPGVWARVVKLPWEMMASARTRRDHAPVGAAVAAQLAVAIAILSVAPIRLANLTSIELGQNLIRPGGPDSDYWLAFPDHDVKNRVRLEFPLNGRLTRLIEEYVHDFRPVLVRGSNENWLFPGQRGGAKGKISFSGQITKAVQRATGLRITVHQFRHAAGAILLRHRPGEYELLRQLLGHKSVQTTINAYVGLQTIDAGRIFGDLVHARMTGVLEAAE